MKILNLCVVGVSRWGINHIRTLDKLGWLGGVVDSENALWSFAPHDISLFNYFFEDLPKSGSSNGIDIMQKGVHDTSITSSMKVVKWGIFLWVDYILLRSIGL